MIAMGPCQQQAQHQNVNNILEENSRIRQRYTEGLAARSQFSYKNRDVYQPLRQPHEDVSV